MISSRTTHRKFRLLAAVVLVGWLSPAAALNPVANFDLNRSLGTWYEIAAIRGYLQSRCARDTRIDFTAAENGAIARHSYCVRDDGTPEVNEGRSRSLDPALPSVQKTTSVYLLGIWWYPFGRETIIIALDPDYRWLATGHPSLRYGRILSRTPTLSDDALKTIAATLAEEGFDLCAFAFTPQTGGRQRGRLCEIVR